MTMPTATAHTAAPDRRHRRLRRGSILILVVALVVLLALMGTAYLSSTQVERGTAAVTAANTQADLVMQGVVDQLQRSMVDSLFDQNQRAAGNATPTPQVYVPATSSLPTKGEVVNGPQPSDGYRGPANLRQAVAPLATSFPYPLTSTYRNWDSDATQLWLASRVPDLRQNNFPYSDANGDNGNPTTAATVNLAGFDAISWPLVPTPAVAAIATGTHPALPPGTINVTYSPLLPSSTALPAQAYQFYDPTALGTTPVPVLGLGVIYSPIATYIVGDVVTDGPPTNRFFYCAQSPPTPQPLSNPRYWTPVDALPTTAGGQLYQPKQFRRFEPTVLPSSANAAVHLPAFRVYATPTTTGQMASSPGQLLNTIIAADADGDGIADACYCLVPGGPVNGVTYYYATRVVDNAAALNASTAADMTCDFGVNGVNFMSTVQTPQGYNPSLFPSNVGLQELMFDYLPTTPQYATLSTHYGYVLKHWNHASTTFDNFSSYPYADTLQPGIGGTPTQRSDYSYITQGDQWYHQMARRLDHPGWTSLGAAGGADPFHAFTQADGLPLADRFCLLPVDRSTSGALSPLLPETIGYLGSGGLTQLPHVPYDPANTGGVGAIGSTRNHPADGTHWFDTNFDYNDDLLATATPLTNTRTLRPIVVTRNGVANRTAGPAMPTDDAALTANLAAYPNVTFYDTINPGMVPYDPPVANPSTPGGGIVGGSPAPTYTAGQWVKCRLPDGTWRAYRCIQDSVVTNPMPDPRDRTTTSPFLNSDWSAESWSATATKTSVNTASFPELWRSYYGAMADRWNTAPGTAPDGGTYASPQPAAPPANSVMIPQGSSTTASPYRCGVAMFKSPIRTLGTTAGSPPIATNPLSDVQMVQLRAALSAANAMDLRDGDNDVTSRNVMLYDDPKLLGRRAPVHATVFGGEKQPFITKVVVVNRAAENLPAFVAVELYNPYVDLQYPAGEMEPTNGNGVVFSMGDQTTDKVAAPPAGQQLVYLGCRLGAMARFSADSKIQVTGTAAEIDVKAGRTFVTEAQDPSTKKPSSFAGCPYIAPGKYLVLVSDATSLPPHVTLPTNATGQSNYFEVKSLASLVNVPIEVYGAPAGPLPLANPAELVLYRTRSATGVARNLSVASTANNPPSVTDPPVTVDPMQAYNEANLIEMCPFDQFDATNHTLTDSVVNLYYRPTEPPITQAGYSPPTPATATDYWKCVYPIGATATYMPAAFTPGSAASTGTGGEPTTTLDYLAPNPPPDLQLGVGMNTPPAYLAPPGPGQPPPPGAVATPTPWHVIQWNNTDWPAPHTTVISSTVVNIYPISGFARNGDLLQVPFIGSYTLAEIDPTVLPPTNIYQPAPATALNLIEVNSVSMDALLAEDHKVYGATPSPMDVATVDDPTATNVAAGSLLEQVGRFCPLTATALPLNGVNDDTDPYRWASRLFDYLTVTAPHDDYMPNADPAKYAQQFAAQQTPVGVPSPSNLPIPVANTAANTSLYPGASPSPAIVPGVGPGAANCNEDQVPVQGLVNINTASWRVLSMLPLVRYTAADNLPGGPPLDGTVNVKGSAYMAQLIVRYRQQHGPFKSIMDLNRVVDAVAAPTQTFQAASNFAPSAGMVGDTIGFSPGADSGAATLMGPATYVQPAIIAVPQTTGKLVMDGRQGVLTPNDPANLYPTFSTTTPYGPNTGVYDDFQTKFLSLGRISNLITTRSDSFTCYVLVQGWQDGKVVSERRSAFVLDRASVGYTIDPVSGVRQLNTTPTVTPISTGK